MNATPLCVTVHIDGASRGNPGPAAAAAVVAADDDGTVLREKAIFLGKTTNNVAEYRALLLGLEAAAEIGAEQVAVFSDSELLVRQMAGQYRVKSAGLRPLFAQAVRAAERFTTCTFTYVPREENKDADRLANRALDVKGNVGDGAE